MYTIDIALKHSPSGLSVQRKSPESAEEVYQQVLRALRGEITGVIELTCEKVEGKKLAVLAGEIVSVQIVDKSATAGAGGRTAGFAAMVAN